MSAIAGDGGWLVRLQRAMIFPAPMRPPTRDVVRDVPDLVRLARSVEGANVEAWLLPVSGRGRAPLVVFAHGNGELIDDWPIALEGYRRLGCHVLIPEFRSYGRSGGSPSERHVVDDFAHFVAETLRRPDVDEERVVYVGRSLGGGVVCSLARRRVPRAMILMSTFTSVRAMARRFLFPGRLIVDAFDNEAVVKRLDVPLWILHGSRDLTVPLAHGERLAAVAPRARITIERGAGHNDCPGDWGRYYAQVEAFFRDAGVLA